ncbi:MAG: hypothetical protein KGH64_00995 [Candidatus Micrarchaeota archaeon]|nr:hypothetical protein [Candidatus Micrarchaeota archaeon]
MKIALHNKTQVSDFKSALRGSECYYISDKLLPPPLGECYISTSTYMNGDRFVRACITTEETLDWAHVLSPADVNEFFNKLLFNIKSDSKLAKFDARLISSFSTMHTGIKISKNGQRIANMEFAGSNAFYIMMAGSVKSTNEKAPKKLRSEVKVCAKLLGESLNVLSEYVPALAKMLDEDRMELDIILDTSNPVTENFRFSRSGVIAQAEREVFSLGSQMTQAALSFLEDRGATPEKKAVNNMLYGLRMADKGDVVEAKVFLQKAFAVLTAGHSPRERMLSGSILEVIKELERDPGQGIAVYNATTRVIEEAGASLSGN